MNDKTKDVEKLAQRVIEEVDARREELIRISDEIYAIQLLDTLLKKAPLID